MNFSPFGGHFPASIPTIHQFAAKFGTPDTPLGGVAAATAALGHNQDVSRYHGPGAGGAATSHFNQHHSPLAMPVNMGKFRNDNNVQTTQNQQHNMMNVVTNGPTKYHTAGFYRKDHLRKHTRSHIARRVKAELSQQAGTPNLTGSLQSGQVAAPGPPTQPNQQAIMS